MGYQREAALLVLSVTEIAVALETDQLSTMSHALPCAWSDE